MSKLVAWNILFMEKILHHLGCPKCCFYRAISKRFPSTVFPPPMFLQTSWGRNDTWSPFLFLIYTSYIAPGTLKHKITTIVCGPSTCRFPSPETVVSWMKRRCHRLSQSHGLWGVAQGGQGTCQYVSLSFWS